MASSRKKQDEKNLKTLRELASLAQNKYCFDCNQRGPTYVNVTIGSFVCTKCSGMLRGITPPHRVKSISMTTFTQEEIDMVRSKGNEYCKRVWLGLFEGGAGAPSPNPNDEQSVRDLMVEKYERRRYYLEPGVGKPELPPQRPRPPVSEPKPVRQNGLTNGTATVPPPQNTHRTRPEANRTHVDFVADFDKADIFSMSNGNNASINNNHNGNMQNGITNGFANFDNNPVFTNHTSNGSSTVVSADDFSIFDLKFTNSGPMLNQVPLFPKCSPVNNNNDNGFTTLLAQSGLNLNNWTQQQQQVQPQPAQTVPVEDKYAALKDLDNALKSQSAVDWGSTGSNGSLYSSPTPTGSMYSSSSPQSSLFGSPSQSNFMSAFQPLQENGMSTTTNGAGGVSNPFSNGTFNWNSTNGNITSNSSSSSSSNGSNGAFPNPFRDATKSNGFSQGFQPLAFPINPMPVNGAAAWAPNPFKVGATGGMNSNNPFL
ncbi:unnamed protein product [Brassicogethes aeneus]|uniref:Arf-GAP domain-containing protein n=1 Tax=Brassicogethes aeneus TaxID=1431903 RepID=A0A9P0B9W6_BRAAE|nr:unnamed protein product [Brassicogethes aeneus]